MGRDLPDGTRKMTIAYTGGFVGLEELAVRLGSIVPYNLLGNVVLMEDFETTLTEWVADVIGVGNTVARSTTHKYSGSYSIEFDISTPGTNWGMVTRHIYYPGVDKYGLFCRAAWDDSMEVFDISVSFYDGIYVYGNGVKYDYLNKRLQIYDDTGDWVTIDDDLDLGFPSLTWCPMLFTFDLASLLFDKVYIAGHEYDISAYGVFREADDTPEHGEIVLIAAEEGGGGFIMYADDVVLVKGVP